MTDARNDDLDPPELAALTRWFEARPASSEPPAIELAAWLDGESDAALAARVEAWLAGDPALCLALPPRTGVAPEPVPERELQRALALVVGTRRRAFPVAAVMLRLAGGGLELAAGIGGLAVGLALAQAQSAAEGAQAVALFADFAAGAGAW